MARTYWANQSTGLVSDVPGEIMLAPGLWGEAAVGRRRTTPPALDHGAQEYFDALSDLVASFEDEHAPIPDASESDVLRELWQSSGLTQTALAKAVGISQSTLSAVFSGDREMTKGHMLALAKFFNVPPAVFLPS